MRLKHNNVPGVVELSLWVKEHEQLLFPYEKEKLSSKREKILLSRVSPTDFENGPASRNPRWTKIGQRKLQVARVSPTRVTKCKVRNLLFRTREAKKITETVSHLSIPRTKKTSKKCLPPSWSVVNNAQRKKRFCFTPLVLKTLCKYELMCGHYEWAC